MTTKNPRVHVTFEPSTAGLLSTLAHQEHKSIATLVRDLTLEALERREDLHFSQIAEQRDIPGVQTHSHGDAWK